MFNDKKITFDSFIRGILGGAVIIFILYMLKRLSGVLLPFFVSWIVAYLTYPMVIFYQERLKLKNRALSILAVMITLLLIGILVGLFFIPPMVEEMSKLKHLVELYFQEGKNSALPLYIKEFLRDKIDYQIVRDFLNPESISNALHEIIPQIGNLLSTSYNIVLTVFTLFVMLLYYFFILLDYEQIADGWITLLPNKYRTVTMAIVTDVKESMNKYFRGQSFVAFCVGVLFSIGFLIIDFPLAVVLGMFIGLLNMVPYLQIIGIVPTLFLALLKAADTGDNFWWILCSAILVFCVVQLIQDAFIVPRVMGKITGLNPAIILLSLSIWGSLMGVLGMIIALPCTTLLLSYYQRYIHKGENTLFFTDVKSLGYQEDKKNEEK